MVFDIIPVSSEELEKYTVVQMKMLRTAQQKKDELEHKMQLELKIFRENLLNKGMRNSSLYEQKRQEADEEFKYQVAILVDNLLYNMSLNEPTSGDDMPPTDSDPSTGYIVDYSLSYAERYVLVRDYYLTIEDYNERITMYKNDKVAMKYLDTYYDSLFDFLYTYKR